MNEEMLRIKCGSRVPVEFVAVASDRLRVLLPDDSREYRPAHLLRVGDIVECRGLVTAIESLSGAA